MSKINIKLMSEAAYVTLKKNIDSYAQEFINNPSDASWVNNVTSENVFETKKYQIEDFELKIPSSFNDRTTDLVNSITLYEHLNILPGYILSEPRFWLWIMFEKGYQAALAGMEKIDVTSFKHQWLFVDGLRRGLFFGILSRLYYRVELTYAPENKEDPYYLTKYVMENPVRFREISWRTISNQKFVVKAMLKAEIRVNSTLQFDEKGKYFSELAKDICKLGSIKLIDAMDEDEIEKYIYDKYYNIVASEIEKIKLNKYNDAIDQLNASTEKSIKNAGKIFQELNDYMDSKSKLEECERKLKELRPKSLFNFFKSKNNSKIHL